MKKLAALLSLGLWVLGAPAGATTKETFTYDALGRLVRSCHAPSSNAYAFRTDYTLDSAGNRQNLSAQDEALYMPAVTRIWSQDGTHHLTMQSDGNFVLYGPTTAIWATNTNGSGATRATMQGDGNLVVSTSAGVVVWASGTNGNPCARLLVQNDGNMVIYSADDVAIWTTNTTGQ